MGITNPGGLPYPESTDPVNQGAVAIKALATAVSIRGATRPLGTLGNVGTFDANKPVYTYAGYTIANTDATGQLSVALPAGVTCLLAAFATPFYQAAEMLDVQWVLRLEQSSVTTTRWMARRTLDGSAYASVRMGIQVLFVLQ